MLFLELPFLDSMLSKIQPSSKLTLKHTVRLLTRSPRIQCGSADTFHSSALLYTEGPSKLSEPQTVAQKPTRRDRNRLRVFPFLVIIGVGTGAFALLVKDREGKAPKPRSATTQPISDAELYRQPRRNQS